MKLTDAIKLLPWVTYLPKQKTPRPCDGLRYSSMPLKALFHHGPNQTKPPTGTTRYKCKVSARWRFKALKKSDAKDGVFCWSHLWSQCLWHMGEHDRAKSYFDKHLKQHPNPFKEES